MKAIIAAVLPAASTSNPRFAAVHLVPTPHGVRAYATDGYVALTALHKDSELPAPVTVPLALAKHVAASPAPLDLSASGTTVTACGLTVPAYDDSYPDVQAIFDKLPRDDTYTPPLLDSAQMALIHASLRALIKHKVTDRGYSYLRLSVQDRTVAFRLNCTDLAYEAGGALTKIRNEIALTHPSETRP